jgi:hypothetical protein
MRGNSLIIGGAALVSFLALTVAAHACPCGFYSSFGMCLPEMPGNVNCGHPPPPPRQTPSTSSAPTSFFAQCACNRTRKYGTYRGDSLVVYFGNILARQPAAGSNVHISIPACSLFPMCPLNNYPIGSVSLHVTSWATCGACAYKESIVGEVQ